MNIELYAGRDTDDFARLASPMFKDFIGKEEYFLKEMLDKGDHVLECGSGGGRLMRVLAPIVKRVTGLDFSDLQLMNARGRCYHTNLDFMRGDITNLPFREDLFDASIMMWNTLGGMGDKKVESIREMGRVTKTGGKIIVSVYAENAFPYQKEYYENGLGWRNVKSVNDETHAEDPVGHVVSERFTKEKLQGIFQDAGLDPKIKKLNEFSYVAVALK